MQQSSTTELFFTKRFAANTFLLLLSAVSIFHILVLTGIIPYAIAWGGRLKSREEMISFETTSLALNMLFMILVHDKIYQSVAQTFLSVRFEAVFEDYTGKNACATEAI